MRRFNNKTADSLKKTEASWSNMAASWEAIENGGSCEAVSLSKAAYLQDFMQEIIPKITGENLKAMKRFMVDVISLNVGVVCDSAGEFLAELSKYHCINGHDLDLLEDLLGVTGRSDILDLLRGFKKKLPSVLESVSTEAVEKMVSGEFSIFFPQLLAFVFNFLLLPCGELFKEPSLDGEKMTS